MGNNPQHFRTPTAAQAQRMGRIMDLRTAGLGYEEISKQVGCSRSTAFRTYQQAIRFYLAEHNAEEAAAAMQMQLNAMIRAVWPMVLRGDLKAIDRAIRIQHRQAALLGLDAPTKHVIEVLTEDTVDAAIARLTAEQQALAAGAPVPAEP